MINYVNLA